MTVKHIIFFVSGNLIDSSRNTFNSLCKNSNDIDWIYVDWQSEINRNMNDLNTQSQFNQNMLMFFTHLNKNPQIYEIIQSIIYSECLNAIEKYDNIMVSFMGDNFGSVILYNILDQTPKDFVIGDTIISNITRGILIFIGSNLSFQLVIKDGDKPPNSKRIIPILHILDPNDPFAYLLEPYFSHTNKKDIMVMPYSSKSWKITKMFWHFMLGFVYLNPLYWFDKFNKKYMKLDMVIDKMKSTPHIVDVLIQPQTLHPFKQVINHYSQYLSNPDVQLLITDVIKNILV